VRGVIYGTGMDNAAARRVKALCINGQIEGAIRLSKVWLIPKDVQKPVDGRTKNGRTVPRQHRKKGATQ
jgi:hypothetical protein